MKATWNGVTLAESSDTVVVEGNHYFPATSLNRDYVSFSNTIAKAGSGLTHCRSTRHPAEAARSANRAGENL